MDLTDSDGDFDANHLSGPTPGKIENNNNDGNDNNSDMDLVTSDDDDVALDIDVLVNEAKVNMRNWALAQDDEGFTGYAKVFTYTSMDEAINITIKLVPMPEGPTSEGARQFAIEVADCAGREVYSEKQFVVASHPRLELDGGSYGAVFVLHPISERKFGEMELGDNSPVLDMLVYERNEWHNIHGPPHEFLAMNPHAVTVGNHEGEVYRHEVWTAEKPDEGGWDYLKAT